MGREIERKFLVCSDAWRGLAPGRLYRQGYICSEPDRTVRVRLIEAPGGSGGFAFLTIKGRPAGLCRAEFEYEIPFADGTYLLERMAERPLIEKYRYRIPVEGLVWEVDEFLGENAGLVVAELELAAEDQVFSRPVWLGAEVTDDRRYANSSLARHPFCRWGTGGRG